MENIQAEKQTEVDVKTVVKGQDEISMEEYLAEIREYFEEVFALSY